MTPIKVYFDEDVHPFIAEALRRRGWEALTTVEAEKRESADLDQIRFATEGGYAILTYNVRDFPRFHQQLIAAGEKHAGILIATQDDPNQTIRILLNLLGTFSAKDLYNQLLYVNNWE